MLTWTQNLLKPLEFPQKKRNRDKRLCKKKKDDAEKAKNGDKKMDEEKPKEEK